MGVIGVRRRDPRWAGSAGHPGPSPSAPYPWPQCSLCPTPLPTLPGPSTPAQQGPLPEAQRQYAAVPKARRLRAHVGHELAAGATLKPDILYSPVGDRDGREAEAGRWRCHRPLLGRTDGRPPLANIASWQRRGPEAHPLRASVAPGRRAVGDCGPPARRPASNRRPRAPCGVPLVGEEQRRLAPLRHDPVQQPCRPHHRGTTASHRGARRRRPRMTVLTGGGWSAA